MKKINNYKILGNRIPYEFFVTKGKGQSDAGSEQLPYETGSIDDALNEARIQNYNIMYYTSVIPTEAKEISFEEGLKRCKWGEVLECIMSVANGKQGEKISSAVITTDIYEPSGKYLGGFACEYSGSGNKSEAQQSLMLSIVGMIKRRGYGILDASFTFGIKNKTDKGYTIHPGKIFVFEELEIQKKHGSVLTSLCFVSFKYPFLTTTYSKKNEPTKKNRHFHF